MTCPKESQHAEFAHVELGEGEYRHLKRKLTHSEAQQIEVAMLAANYTTAGSSQMVQALIRSALSGAPADWRNGYEEPDGTKHEGQFEPTMALVARWLEQYETDHELALMKPETRRYMAEATFNLHDTLGRVFTLDGDVWPPENGQHARIIERKAQTLWQRWNEGMDDRLKAAGADSG